MGMCSAEIVVRVSCGDKSMPIPGYDAMRRKTETVRAETELAFIAGWIAGRPAG